jgi:hypothetical protein
VMGGGALAEVDLTTRLALVLRAGLLRELPDGAGGGDSAPNIAMATLGFSIY